MDITLPTNNSNKRELLKYVQRAEQAGFTLALSSDHFHPWSEDQGQSGFAWSWLGAAMQATPTLSYRVVCAPGQRYHPAIIAQAAATLAEMFPNRFWLTVGSGQAVNEHITGEHWPYKSESISSNKGTTKLQGFQGIKECFANSIINLWGL